MLFVLNYAFEYLLLKKLEKVCPLISQVRFQKVLTRCQREPLLPVLKEAIERFKLSHLQNNPSEELQGLAVVSSNSLCCPLASWSELKPADEPEGVTEGLSTPYPEVKNNETGAFQ